MSKDIIKYQVKKEIEPINPMYGITQKLSDLLDSEEEAINTAKKYKNAYVVKKTYTSQANLNGDFSFTERVCYAPWLKGGW